MINVIVIGLAHQLEFAIEDLLSYPIVLLRQPSAQ